MAAADGLPEPQLVPDQAVRGGHYDKMDDKENHQFHTELKRKLAHMFYVIALSKVVDDHVSLIHTLHTFSDRR
ncbi:hypothetical protein DPMN_048015 [Dreissena polymorpha]|uniref:Uncharacterized protein n=1 Tax=Dreissena polymorpha TaxID=45954 RepID=A0A9D4I207_DREPO|nr:hypothetical protein DPMN_048015 [Dreissena polymorpha]